MKNITTFQKHVHTPIYDEESSETLCSSCGIIMEQKQEVAPRIRPTIDRESHEKDTMGAGYSIPSINSTIDKGSYIGITAIDGQGNKLPQSVLAHRHHLVKASRLTLNYKERSDHKFMKVAIATLNTVGVPKHLQLRIIDIIKKTRKQDREERKKSGRTIVGMTLAATFIAYREAEIPCSIQNLVRKALADFGSDTVNNKSEFAIRCREVRRNSKRLQNKFQVKLPPSRPSQELGWIASNLGVSKKVTNRAMQILLQVEGHPELIGKSPKGLAGCAVYMASEETGERLPHGQLTIANMIDSNTVTLRRNVKLLSQLAGLNTQSKA